MQHTLAAVFEDRNKAQHAVDDLMAEGFSSEDIRLTQSESKQDQLMENRRTDDESGGGMMSFFRGLFGDDSRDDDVELYSEAVRRGNYVLTVNVPDDDLVDRATDVLDRNDPIDIDEKSAQWRSGGWAAQDSMRMNQSGTTASSLQDSDIGTSAAAGAGIASGARDEKSIPVIEEELKIGKREVQRGGVRVYQRVTETPVTETVQLREEKVEVERRPVDKPANPSDLSSLKEGSFEMRESAEEAVAEKTARVVEEVVVGKTTTQHEEQISDTVKRTDVEVERLSGQSDPDRATRYAADAPHFRDHWKTNYETEGGQYEDYAPAYQYGSALGRSNRFQSQQWSDVEAHARHDWEAQNPGTWEKVKSAAQHGWEKVRS